MVLLHQSSSCTNLTVTEIATTFITDTINSTIFFDFPTATITETDFQYTTSFTIIPQFPCARFLQTMR